MKVIRLSGVLLVIILALGSGLAGAQPPAPTATPNIVPTPTPTPAWWEGEKPPWLLAVALAALGVIIGALLRPTLERWGKAVDRWLQGLGFGFEKAYLEALAEKHRYLKLVGVRGKTVAGRPKLEDVYVSLQIGAPGGGTEAGTARPGEMSVGEALQAHKRLVVLGEPGAGKSTLLRYLLLTFSGDIPQSRLGLAEKRLPIYVRLKDCLDGDKPICEILALPPTLPLSKYPPGFFERRLKRGQCIVLLDGLDEVVDEDQKKMVAEKVGQMVRDYPDNRYIVTCRTAGWNPNLLPGSFVALKIRDFNPAQVARFIHDWYKAILTDEKLSTAGKDEEKQQQARQEAAAEAQRRAGELVAALETHEGLARLSKNPLILSLIALVHYHRFRLPQRRATIYQDCLEVLLDQWDRDEHGLVLPDAPTPEAKLLIVQEIANNFQTSGRDEAGLDELSALIAPILRAQRCKVGPEECLRVQIVERSGLLAERAIGRYGFTHRTLQEYLAAKTIAAVPEKRWELLAHLGEEPWREVVLLYVGMVGVTGATALLREILAKPDDPAGNLLFLAGQCLAEDVDMRVDEPLRKECLSRLDAALRSTADPLLFTRLGTVLAAIGGEDVVYYFERALREGNAQVRLTAAESLGTLGKRIAPARIATSLLTAMKDNQAGVRQVAAVSLGQLGYDSPEVVKALHAIRQEDNDPAVRTRATGSLVRLGHATKLNLVRIPAGEFLMGSEEYDDEKPPHKVYLGEYYMGRYPVPNADFDRFVQAGGYSQKQWWTEDGWQWKGDRSGPKRYGGIFDSPDHPVVGVSWYEAAAYATWTGMRLLTEAEWEKAARGTDGRRWPWGDTFDPSRCNTIESWAGSRSFWSRLTMALRRRPTIGGGTTPVAQYSPAGDSPYGVADMAGNVWEWCQSLYQPYPYRDDDGRENVKASGVRVLRGGSWYYSQGYARCASRFRGNPAYFGDDVGFRVVFSPN
jgi:formylglycine-generating enzyme required for sulfatase activity